MISDKFALQHRLVLRPSKIAEDSGIGVWATRPIKVGDIVCKYSGHFYKRGSTKQRILDDNRYFLNTKNGIIDACLVQQKITDKIGFGGFINDGRSDEKNNCKYFICGDKAYVTAIKNINPDEELFVSYGHTYWQAKEQNVKLDKLVDEFIKQNVT